MCPSCGQWSKFWCGPHSMDGRVVAILKLITSFPFPMHSVGKTFFHKSNQMGNWWFSNLWPHEEYDMRRHHCMYSAQRVPEPDPLPGISFDTRPDPIQF